MRTYGKLTRNGNCHAVIVPRVAMAQLGWSADEPIVFYALRGKLVVASMRSEVDRLERESADLVTAVDAGTTTS